MKKLYTFALLTFTFGLNVNAQNFVYTPVQHLDEVVEAENYSAHEIKMITSDQSGVQFKWEKISNTFPEGWSYSLCDLGGCYVGVPPSGTMSPITESQAQNGVKGFLKLNLTASNYYGEGDLIIYIYDAAKPNEGDTISFHLTWADPSVTEINEGLFSQIEMYPNPVNSELNLLNVSAISTIEIIDAVGRTQLKEINNNSITKIDLSTLPEGVYFARLTHHNGQMITKKLIKK